MSRNLSQIARVALFCGALFAPPVALAQAELNPAIKAYNEGQYDRAAVYLYDFITENAADANRAKAEFYLGQTLEKARFYQSALFYYGSIVNEGPRHPYYVQAAEALIDVAEALDDDLIIPSLLSKEYDEEFHKLRPAYLHKVNYFVGLVSHRAGQLEDAQAFLGVVPADSSYYARARYLLGIVAIQAGRSGQTGSPEARFESASREAMAYFKEVLALPEMGGVRYTELKDLKDLARLGVARSAYGLGEYGEAIKYYEAVPRFSEYWDEALFENGWARFQNDDFGGALGSLQALHAPQFAGSFQPESWILKATIYYSACLYDEANGALKTFEQNYGEMKKRVEPALEGNRDLAWYYKLITDAKLRNQLPRAVYNYIGTNKRVRGFNKYIRSLTAERKAIDSNEVFKGSQLQGELVQVIDQQKNILENVAGKFVKGRLDDVVAVIDGFRGQAELIAYETTKSEKERFEQNAGFAEALAGQKLYRPAIPAEDWEYWKFDGEFWIDEIGYYQFTLKSGCPATAE